MKKIKYVLLFLIGFVSCQDFLEEESQDLTAVETVDHFQALMLNEFSNNYPLFKSVYHMTDDLEEIKLAPTARKSNKTTFTWQQEIEIDEEGNTIRNINTSWESMYEDIAVVNYVIETIDDMDGIMEEKEFAKGEAYFIRAMSYFNLLNLYGQPFNEASKETDLGVPIRVNTEIELSYKRKSVADGYALIESDLSKAIDYIEKSGITKSKWHPSVKACNLLMSRVKLYQKKWDEVIVYANKVIADGQLSMMQTNAPFVTEGNEEILYVWHKSYNGLIDAPSSSEVAGYRASETLYDLYESGDNRKDAFLNSFVQGGNTHYINRKHNGGYDGSTSTSVYTTMGYQNLRVGEAYLNKAEALAQGNDVTAIEIIKVLHGFRFANTTSLVYPNTPDEILNYIKNERRRELCFEDHHRWFDLRRMNNRPEIEHIYTTVDEQGDVVKTETYTLFSNDLNYTLPIPIKERENNPGIINNERVDKLPVIN
tara:strand:- start:23899 stop:25344 length:1446 start_codon:yes stop_codon:yes gene_type:complete